MSDAVNLRGASAEGRMVDVTVYIGEGGEERSGGTDVVTLCGTSKQGRMMDVEIYIGAPWAVKVTPEELRVQIEERERKVRLMEEGAAGESQRTE